MAIVWMTRAALAEYLSCTVRTIDRWRKENYLPAPRYVGGRPRWKLKDIDQWIARQPDKADAS